MLPSIEQVRLRVSKNTAAARKSQLGQFLTPTSTAQFMAGLFSPASQPDCRLLDAGAGIGSLSCAFLERCATGELDFEEIEVAAYEMDGLLHEDLRRSLAGYLSRVPLTFGIVGGDFIEHSVNDIQFGGNRFTHVILNPPYKKINSHSHHRLLLRSVGIETVNLYASFVALAIEVMAPGGQLVAIIPRSFCNGPYYRPFRDLVLQRTAIRHMHLFDSRTKAFKDDDVLQENVIILLERGRQQGQVRVSTSTDDSFSDLAAHLHPFERIVSPDDREKFIHIPTSAERGMIDGSAAIRYSLDDIGVSVSTGPVVDFRLRDHLRDLPGPDTVPLIYPAHCHALGIEWPRLGMKKPNAIRFTAETEKWLYPNGFYCVVRRFSSKEERHRIVPSVVTPDAFGEAVALGFENHLNVFHENRQGLSEPLARGLAIYLSTTAVDDVFRRFSGHTQVNAADLRLMKYPSRTALIAMGKWAKRCPEQNQAVIDAQLDSLMA